MFPFVLDRYLFPREQDKRPHLYHFELPKEYRSYSAHPEESMY